MSNLGAFQDFEYDPKDFEDPPSNKDDDDDDFNPLSSTKKTKSKKSKKKSAKKRGKKRKISSTNDTNNNDNNNKDNNNNNNEPKKKKQKRGWSKEEETLFLEGIEKFGRDYNKVSKHIKSRDTASVRSHMQIHLLKLLKDRKKLPDKVLESGNGYTLSGKPLNKYSSTVLKMFKNAKDVPMDMGGVISDEEAANKLKKHNKKDNKDVDNESIKKKVKRRKKSLDDEEYNYDCTVIKKRERISRNCKNNSKKIYDHIADEYQLREDIIWYQPFNKDKKKKR